jgi:hypothetical protein
VDADGKDLLGGVFLCVPSRNHWRVCDTSPPISGTPIRIDLFSINIPAWGRGALIMPNAVFEGRLGVQER